MATKLEKLSRAFTGRELEQNIEVPDGRGGTTLSPSPSDPSLRDLRKAALKIGFSGVCVALPDFPQPRGTTENPLLVSVEPDEAHGVSRIREIRPLRARP